jgi:thioredoxin 1
MAVEKITLQNFDEFIKNGTAVVDFYADWCGPCRMLAPALEQIASEHPEIRVGKVNVDEAHALAARFQISSIPFVARFENGALTHSALGFMPAAMLADKLGI